MRDATSASSPSSARSLRRTFELAGGTLPLLLGDFERGIGSLDQGERVATAGLGAAIVAHRRRGGEIEGCCQQHVDQRLALAAQPVERVSGDQPRRLDPTAGRVDVRAVLGTVGARALGQLGQLDGALPQRYERALIDPLGLQVACDLLDRRAPVRDRSDQPRRTG